MFYLQTDSRLEAGHECTIRTIAFTDPEGQLNIIIERHDPDGVPPKIIGRSVVTLPSAPLEAKAISNGQTPERLNKPDKTNNKTPQAPAEVRNG